MRTKLTILLIAVLLSSLTLKAQETSFEGIWNAVKKTSVIKAIKIQDIGDNRLLVMFKTNDGIEQKEVEKPTGNSLIVTLVDEVVYGKWRVGYRNGSYNYIIGMDGSESAGEATAVYIPNTYATINYEYISYQMALKNGNIELYYKFHGDYTNEYNDVLFMQSSRWSEYGTYTNW